MRLNSCELAERILKVKVLASNVIVGDIVFHQNSVVLVERIRINAWGPLSFHVFDEEETYNGYIKSVSCDSKKYVEIIPRALVKKK